MPVTFSGGGILSVFAVGDGANQALGAFAWPSNQPGFLVSLQRWLYFPLILRNAR